MENKIFININGGFGRVVSATGVVKELKNRNPDTSINIVTGYPEVFIGNPNIDKVYSLNHEYLFEDHINGHKYLEPEPYKLQGYINGDLHLIEGFSKELLNEETFFKPELYLSENELDEARNFVKTIEKPIILFQPFGAMGGKTRDGEKILNDSSFRSLPIEFAKKLYDKLSEKYQVVLVKGHDQAGLKDWITLPPLPLRKVAGLIPFSHGVVCIDSSLQHLCASLDKKAIVLWGSTNKNQLGYDLHTNLGTTERIIQYNPVRIPGNDYDSEKRYKNVWNYLNDSIINKVMEELDGQTKTE